MSAFDQLVITLTYLRQNQTQAVIAEAHGISQPTVSRIIRRVTTRLAEVFGPDLPTVEDLNERETILVDGSLFPCWSWRKHPENYSGKHHTTGVNVQVACSVSGDLRWVSDPLPGSTHDIKAARIHGLDEFPNKQIVADRGYQGLNAISPIKRQPGQEHLSQHDKDFNKQLNGIRSTVERTIAHLKTWKILHIDYRRPLNTFATTITAVTALHFYQITL